MVQTVVDYSQVIDLMPYNITSSTISPTHSILWFNVSLTNQLFTSKDKQLSTMSMIYTLVINFVLFVGFIVFFEYSRHYKQIFLKRYQRRFIDLGQVPPQPSEQWFGWLIAIWRITEIEVLDMVGLDAYMFLRFHVICIK